MLNTKLKVYEPIGSFLKFKSQIINTNLKVQ